MAKSETSRFASLLLSRRDLLQEIQGDDEVRNISIWIAKVVDSEGSKEVFLKMKGAMQFNSADDGIENIFGNSILYELP